MSAVATILGIAVGAPIGIIGAERGWSLAKTLALSFSASVLVGACFAFAVAGVA